MPAPPEVDATKRRRTNHEMVDHLQLALAASITLPVCAPIHDKTPGLARHLVKRAGFAQKF
jgi:hypothetical protein